MVNHAWCNVGIEGGDGNVLICLFTRCSLQERMLLPCQSYVQAAHVNSVLPRHIYIFLSTFCTYFWKVFLNSLISGMENSLNSEYTDCETFAGAISPSFLCCWRFNFEVSSESAMAYWGGGVGSVETQHWGRDRDTVNNLSKSSAYSCLIKILTYLQLLPPLFTTSPVHLSWFTGSIHLSWFTASNLHFPIKSWRRGNKKRGRGIVLVRGFAVIECTCVDRLRLKWSVLSCFPHGFYTLPLQHSDLSPHARSRTYAVHPSRMIECMGVMEEVLPAVKEFAKLRGYWYTVLGSLNEVNLLWEYGVFASSM